MHNCAVDDLARFAMCQCDRKAGRVSNVFVALKQQGASKTLLLGVCTLISGRPASLGQNHAIRRDHVALRRGAHALVAATADECIVRAGSAPKDEVEIIQRYGGAEIQGTSLWSRVREGEEPLSHGAPEREFAALPEFPWLSA